MLKVVPGHTRTAHIRECAGDGDSLVFCCWRTELFKEGVGRDDLWVGLQSVGTHL
jgi:hypothetical protein